MNVISLPSALRPAKYRLNFWERVTKMDVKVTRNLSAYKSTMAAVKGTEKGGSVLAHVDSRVRNDEIHISGEAMKKQEAAKLSSSIHKSMDAGAGPKRLAQIKKQVQEGSYQVSAELIARRLMSGL